MDGILVIGRIDSNTGAFDTATAERVSAAVNLGGSVTLGFAASEIDLTKTIAIAGVSRIVGIQVPDASPNHEIHERAVDALVEAIQPRIILLGFDWETAAFASGLAERRDLAFVSDVIELSNGESGSTNLLRPAYGGKLCTSMSLSGDKPAMLLLRPGNWPAAPADGAGPPIEILEKDISAASRIRLVEVFSAGEGDADLTQAEIIFGLGRGVGSKENVALFEQLTEKLGVALGASRPLVDTGLLPRSRQIGQSGVTVKPRLYVAFGISGSPQHLAGISDSKVVFAVNTDKDAPIFSRANVGACVDAIEVARVLLASD